MAGGGFEFSPEMTMLRRNNQFQFSQRDPHYLSTLANLFDTLTVECSGVLVQPQWKHFRHIQMIKTDQIRLSNGIWRSWHLQFQKRRVPQFCRFDIEPKLDHHKRQAAVVLEGKYWKREPSAVASEYRKWRIHYHRKNKTRLPDPYLAEVVERAMTVFEELQSKPHPPYTHSMDTARMPLNIPDMFDPVFSFMDTSPSIDDPNRLIGFQQPKLDMLNPMLDDFLNRLEPMDVVLPRSMGGSFYSTAQQPLPHASPIFGAPSTIPPPTYHTSYTPPSQVDHFTTSQQQQSLSPTAFLNMPSAENIRGNLDIGELSNYPMKAEPVINSRSPNQNSYSLPGYQQQGNEPFSTLNNNPMTSSDPMTSSEDIFSIQASLQHKVDDMEGAFEVTPPQLTPPPHPHVPTRPTPADAFKFPNTFTFSQANQYTPSSHMTSSQDHMMEQPFVRVSSAGNLGVVTSSPLPRTRPPLERGKSEPINRLRAQVQKLSAEHDKQIQEIDKQKNFAERQYSELLQTVMEQMSSAGKASEQQKQMLQTVLSDPSLVNILRDVLLTIPGPGGQEVGGASAKMSLEEVHRGGVASDLSSPPNVVSPNEVPDYQLLMSGGSTTPLHPSTTPLGPSPYYLSGSDTETTPTGLAGLRVKPSRKLSGDEKEVYRELRRQSHISAEQKRRGSIKQGFDHLQSLVVNLSSYPSGKVSKAVVLEKTIEHIHHTHVVRDDRERKTQALRKEIEELNTAIAQCQEMLPASGVPVTRQRLDENRQRFREYVQRRTQQNYKFWIFGIILGQLFDTYNSTVSTGSVDELCRTVLTWFEQSCTLPALRPIVMTSLRELSQKTTILTDPSQVPRQLAQYAQAELQRQRQEQEKARTTRFSFS